MVLTGINFKVLLLLTLSPNTNPNQKIPIDGMLKQQFILAAQYRNRRHSVTNKVKIIKAYLLVE